jgi:hypothetical protein
MSTEEKASFKEQAKNTVRDGPTTNGKIVATSSKRRGTNDLCVRVVLKCVNNVRYMYRLIKTRKLCTYMSYFVDYYDIVGIGHP